MAYQSEGPSNGRHGQAASGHLEIRLILEGATELQVGAIATLKERVYA